MVNPENHAPQAVILLLVLFCLEYSNLRHKFEKVFLVDKLSGSRSIENPPGNINTVRLKTLTQVVPALIPVYFLSDGLQFLLRQVKAGMF